MCLHSADLVQGFIKGFAIFPLYCLATSFSFLLYFIWLVEVPSKIKPSTFQSSVLALRWDLKSEGCRLNNLSDMGTCTCTFWNPFEVLLYPFFIYDKLAYQPDELIRIYIKIKHITYNYNYIYHALFHLLIILTHTLKYVFSIAIDFILHHTSMSIWYIFN